MISCIWPHSNISQRLFSSPTQAYKPCLKFMAIFLAFFTGEVNITSCKYFIKNRQEIWSYFDLAVDFSLSDVFIDTCGLSLLQICYARLNSLMKIKRYSKCFSWAKYLKSLWEIKFLKNILLSQIIITYILNTLTPVHFLCMLVCVFIWTWWIGTVGLRSIISQGNK